MHHQKQLRAGLADTHAAQQIRQKLQNMQRMLQPVKVINPYAPLIDLPKEVFKPRRTLPLLLSFMEAITFYHQYQREQKAEEATGEIYIETHPADIEAAFKLLQDVLFRKSDELSGAAREFYQWLQSWHQQKKLKQFYAADIRKDHRIHPRTLNRYLQELQEYGLVQIVGGNKHRTGYSYKLTAASDYENLQKSIHTQITQVMENVRQAHEARQAPQAKAPKKKKAGQELDTVIAV